MITGSPKWVSKMNVVINILEGLSDTKPTFISVDRLKIYVVRNKGYYEENRRREKVVRALTYTKIDNN